MGSNQVLVGEREAYVPSTSERASFDRQDGTRFRDLIKHGTHSQGARDSPIMKTRTPIASRRINDFKRKDRRKPEPAKFEAEGDK